MSFRIIKEDKDFQTFKEKTTALIHVDYPLEYLHSATVYGYFDGPNLVGGFIVQEHVSEIRAIKGLDIPEVNNLRRPIELTGLWLSPQREHNSIRTRFWLEICIVLTKYLGRDALFSYSTSKSNLRDLYANFKPVVLYQGFIKPIPGMLAGDHETVCYVSITNVAFHYLRQPKFFLKRLDIRHLVRSYYERAA